MSKHRPTYQPKPGEPKNKFELQQIKKNLSKKGKKK